MGIFSKTCEYGLRAVIFIAQESEQGKKTGVKEIARHIGSPEHFLAKILQSLSKQGLIQSTKGPKGGFYLPEAGFDTSLAAIVHAIDGDQLFTGCAMGLKNCSAKNPCPLHKEFGAIRNDITELLNKTTIGQFNQELFSGKFSLNN